MTIVRLLHNFTDTKYKQSGVLSVQGRSVK